MTRRPTSSGKLGIAIVFVMFVFVVIGACSGPKPISAIENARHVGQVCLISQVSTEQIEYTAALERCLRVCDDIVPFRRRAAERDACMMQVRRIFVGDYTGMTRYEPRSGLVDGAISNLEKAND